MKEISFTIASFGRFLQEKKLMGSKCRKCGSLWLPPRPICIKCHGNELEWVELSGRGKIVTYTVIPFGTMAMMEAGYSREKPYCTG